MFIEIEIGTDELEKIVKNQAILLFVSLCVVLHPNSTNSLMSFNSPLTRKLQKNILKILLSSIILPYTLAPPNSNIFQG